MARIVKNRQGLPHFRDELIKCREKERDLFFFLKIPHAAGGIEKEIHVYPNHVSPNHGRREKILFFVWKKREKHCAGLVISVKSIIMIMTVFF